MKDMQIKVEEQAKPLAKRKPRGFVKLLRESIVVHGVTASFRHWVNRTKKFELLNCAELELTDVLCLPVKAKVSKSRKIHLRACHAGSTSVIG